MTATPRRLHAVSRKRLPDYERQFAIPIVGPGICAGVVGTYVKTVFPDFDLDMIVSDMRHERAG